MMSFLKRIALLKPIRRRRPLLLELSSTTRQTASRSRVMKLWLRDSFNLTLKCNHKKMAPTRSKTTLPHVYLNLLRDSRDRCMNMQSHRQALWALWISFSLLAIVTFLLRWEFSAQRQSEYQLSQKYKSKNLPKNRLTKPSCQLLKQSLLLNSQ